MNLRADLRSLNNGKFAQAQARPISRADMRENELSSGRVERGLCAGPAKKSRRIQNSQDIHTCKAPFDSPRPDGPSVAMNRSKLLTTIKSDLQQLGFRSSPGTNFGATALLFKQVKLRSPLLMMVALRFSRQEADAFTGSICISRTLRWSLQPQDCPAQMCESIPELLGPDERALLLDDELCETPEMRGWWRGFRTTNTARFVEAVKVAAPRMVARESLLEQVAHAPSLQAWSQLRRDLASLREMNLGGGPSASAQERCGRRHVGLREAVVEGGWLDAAEHVAKNSALPPIASHPNDLRHLAQEAWTLHRSGFNLQKL